MRTSRDLSLEELDARIQGVSAAMESQHEGVRVAAQYALSALLLEQASRDQVQVMVSQAHGSEPTPTAPLSVQSTLGHLAAAA